MNEQLKVLIESLPPEQQMQFMMAQQQNQQPQQEWTGNLTPQQKMDAGNPDAFRDYEGEGLIIDDKQAQAEALRGRQTPQGINTANAGFVAASPLSHIAAGVEKFKGSRDALEALAEKEKLSALKTKTSQDVASKSLQQQQAKALRGSPLQGMANTQEINPLMGA